MITHLTPCLNKIPPTTEETVQSLVVAARACHTILFGAPDPGSFDISHLITAIDVLTEMATELDPTFDEEELTND